MSNLRDKEVPADVYIHQELSAITNKLKYATDHLLDFLDDEFVERHTRQEDRNYLRSLRSDLQQATERLGYTVAAWNRRLESSPKS